MRDIDWQAVHWVVSEGTPLKLHTAERRMAMRRLADKMQKVNDSPYCGKLTSYEVARRLQITDRSVIRYLQEMSPADKKVCPVCREPMWIAEGVVEPGDEVYEGMVIGENSRNDDMDVNCVREKKLTNMRASGTDESERLIPPKKLNMEGALEFCREDECVEVTPAVVRIRKVVLDQNERARATSRQKKANLAADS